MEENAEGLPETICHYTSLKAALSMISEKSIRAYHFKDMEDESEIEYAKEFLMEYFPDKNIPRENILHYLDETIFSALGKDMYITSFSCRERGREVSDNDGHLSMWRNYGRGDDPVYLEFSRVKSFPCFFAFL